MKIVIVTGQFPSISETFVMNHVTALIDRGHDVEVFAFKKNELTDETHHQINEYGLMNKVHYYHPPQKRLKRLWRMCSFIKQLKYWPYFMKIFSRHGDQFYDRLNKAFMLQYFLDGEFDVIHCHFGHNANKLIFLKEVMPDIKFIVTFHGADIRLGEESHGKIYEKLFACCDRVIAIGEYNKERLEYFGCPACKIVMLPNGVDTEKFKPPAADGKTGRSPIVITTVGRCVEDKDPTFALQVMRNIADETEDEFKYNWIGDGHLRDDFIREAFKLGLGEIVNSPGALNQEAVKQYLQNTDIFFLPSKNEAFPVVLLEAQAMGNPVVATDVGGVRKGLIEGKTGFIVESNDAKQAKEKILQLMKDVSKRKSMSNEARRFIADNFDINKLTERLLAIYHDEESEGVGEAKKI